MNIDSHQALLAKFLPEMFNKSRLRKFAYSTPYCYKEFSKTGRRTSHAKKLLVPFSLSKSNGMRYCAAW
ncbi:predicted protein [Botrytis cinerea T4]|uniref:Uncharacterized protein n=1 Tax=Botryotinia fuckeliana (strain T4) TaxID=999810 RepID=G2YNU4_BOTF4|nr:predicted protein [Botrytis cinerea T4]